MSTKNDDSVFASLQQVAGTRYNRSTFNRDIIDTYVLRKAREKGVRLPTGGPPEEYKYLGAHVETPTAGMSHHVIYVDVSSMYPNFIIGLNASPETIVGTKDELEDSEYTEDDCVWGYIDPRPVKHLSKGEPWRQYVDGTFKVVYDPHNNDSKWTCDEPEWSSKPTGDGPQYTKLYFLDHDTEKGFLTECVEDLIDLKNQYRGTSLYGSTKRVTNCFTDDTKILTPNGEKLVKNVEEGEMVYTFDVDTHRIHTTDVNWTAEFPFYDGTVYRFSNDDVDLQVTPDHQMVYVAENGETVVTTAEALARELKSRDVAIPSPRGDWADVTGTVLTSDDVERYDTSYGVYCLNVGGDNTVLTGRGDTFTPVLQSVYGVTGFATEDSSFRLFDWRLAEAITLCGRKMIQYSRDYILDYLHERGYEDAYAALGDTDGVGISVPSASTRHEALSVVEDAVEQLNGQGYDEFFQSEFNVPPDQHRGEIEIESYAPKVFVPSQDPPHGDIGAKKRYIEWITLEEKKGELVEVDDISLTGLEAVRSDVAPVTQDAQEAFAEALRMDDGEGREYLYPRLREMSERIADGSMSLDSVCKRGGIGQSLDEYGSASRRPAPLYRGAKYANEYIDGVTIQEGSKPRCVYIKEVNGEYPSTYDSHTAEDGDVVDAVTLPDPAKLPEAFEVDWERHWEKTLREPLKPLLQTRGWSWSEIRHNHNQSTFSSF